MDHQSSLVSWSIRRKLFLLICVVFLPAAAMLIVRGLQERRNSMETAKYNTLLLVESLAAQQEQAAAGIRQTLITLAQLPEVRRLDVAACNQLFGELCERQHLYSAMGLATRDGRLIAGSPPLESIEIDISDRKHFKDAVTTLDFSAGEYMVGRVSGVPSINYAYPVLDVERNLIAVVIIGFKLDEYGQFIKKVNLPEGSVLGILDHRGTRLYRLPDNDATPQGKYVTKSAMERVTGGSEQGTYENTGEDGIYRIYAFKHLHLRENSPPYLYMMVGIPKAGIVHEANMEILGSLLMLASVAAIVMSLAWVVGNFALIAPIKRLVGATRQLGSGETGVRTGLRHTPDELGQLARSFDDMVSLLETRDLDRRRAEEELRQSEEKYRRLFETLIDVYYRTDNTGKITMVSPSITKNAGYRPEEVLGSNLRDYYANPEERKSFLKAVMESGFVDNFEVQMKSKDGSLLWVSVNARLFKDEAGNILGVEGISRDITCRKQAEEALNGAYSELEMRVRERTSELSATNAALMVEIAERKESEDALRESEKRYKSLYRMIRLMCDNAPDMIWAKDMEGRFIFVNRAMSANLLDARDTDEPIGKTDLYFAEREKASRPEQPDWHTFGEICIDSDRVIMSTKRVQRFNELGNVHGKPLFLDVYKAPFLNEHGEMIGTVGCGRDVTRERYLEEERRQSEEEKERLKAQLLQSQKLEAIGTLAGGIAHDFNNILGPIIAYTEMALMDLPQLDPMKSDLQHVINAAHRAKDLVKQILSCSRYGREQQRVPTDISLIIREALKLLRATLPTTIEIKEKIEKGAVLADATQIHQVLVNLCTNAAHAMDDTGTLGVSLVAVDLTGDDLASLPVLDLKPGQYLKLSVKDTGHGMDAETMRRIFDPYFTTKEVGKGSGLGLAVVHGIVNRHEGAVLVHSEVGKGSTFDIYLPGIKPKAEVPAEMNLALPVGVERILFVDDEPAATKLGTRLLERLGYRVASTTNSRKALELFLSTPDEFDLIVTDFTMPLMTGADLAREILSVRPDIPIILCTGFSEKVTAKSAEDIGITEFAMKPLNVKQLADLVRKVLDTKKC